MKLIKTTTTCRGDVWYYVDGKRIGYCEAQIIQSRNLCEEIGTLFTVREGFANNKDAQAMLNANIFTEKIGYSEFGFFFDTAVDALDALKKLEAHFTERLSSADITGDAEHFGNKRLATYRKGNLEVDEKIFPEETDTVAEMSTISIIEYNTMLSWAEKISNGQLDKKKNTAIIIFGGGKYADTRSYQMGCAVQFN